MACPSNFISSRLGQMSLVGEADQAVGASQTGSRIAVRMENHPVDGNIE
jgi:hypothetical protein